MSIGVSITHTVTGNLEKVPELSLSLQLHLRDRNLRRLYALHGHVQLGKQIHHMPLTQRGLTGRRDGSNERQAETDGIRDAGKPFR